MNTYVFYGLFESAVSIANGKKGSWLLQNITKVVNFNSIHQYRENFQTVKWSVKFSSMYFIWLVQPSSFLVIASLSIFVAIPLSLSMVHKGYLISHNHNFTSDIVTFPWGCPVKPDQ